MPPRGSPDGTVGDLAPARRLLAYFADVIWHLWTLCTLFGRYLLFLCFKSRTHRGEPLRTPRNESDPVTRAALLFVYFISLQPLDDRHLERGASNLEPLELPYLPDLGRYSMG